MNDPNPDENFHRAYVGPIAEYDVGAAHQFNLLTMVLGLREYHSLLEIGCGSLRAGRLLITYLLADRYCGLEPNRWLVEAGLEHELGATLAAARRPVFEHNEEFELGAFGRSFDFIIAQSILSHTSQSQMLRCMESAAAVLEPEGIFAATFVEGEDYTGDAWVYPEIVTFTLDTVSRLAERAGLRCHPLAWNNQNHQRWVLLTRPERQAALPQLGEVSGLRAELAVLRGRLESTQRRGVSPADWVKVQTRLMTIAEHPRVQAAIAEDPALREVVLGASP